jgi:predicted DNA-binding transcriptional regulator AlpA
MEKSGRRVLSRRALREERGLDYGDTQLDVLIRRDGFPRPFLLGQRKRFWFEDEIDAWIARRAEASRARAA